MQIDAVLPSLSLEPCRPSWWMKTGHMQTIGGHFLGAPSLPEDGEKWVVDLPDGDRLVSFCHEGPSDTVVSVYHGLSGDSNADYMRRTALLCQKLGHTCVRVNHRGAGPGAGLAQAPYHSGRSEDISFLLQQLRLKYPGKKQIIIGFSMSGNIILHLLSRRENACLPDAAIVANAAIDLLHTSRNLHKGLNRIYDLRFVYLLRQMVKDQNKLHRFSRMYDFDEAFTAPMAGFRNRDHYYAEASSKSHVQFIQTPVYVLAAADDPFVSIKDYEQAKWSQFANVHIEKFGGHLGFITSQRTPLGSHYWLDYYLSEALQSLGKVVK